MIECTKQQHTTNKEIKKYKKIVRDKVQFEAVLSRV